MHLFFAALGFFTALFFTRRKASLSASIGLVLGLYFANSIGQVSDTVKALSWLTPFRYMDPGDIFAEGSINPPLCPASPGGKRGAGGDNLDAVSAPGHNCIG